MHEFQRAFGKNVTQGAGEERGMLPIHPNALELWTRYRALEPTPGTTVAPWLTALRVWWQFMRRREALVAARRRSRTTWRA